MNEPEIKLVAHYGYLTVSGRMPPVTIEGGSCGPIYGGGYSFGDMALIVAATVGGTVLGWVVMHGVFALLKAAVYPVVSP